MKTLLILILTLFIGISTAGDTEVALLAAELRAVQLRYEEKMSELEERSSLRWARRQEGIREREEARAVRDRQRSSLERLYGSLSRAREEVVSRESIRSAEESKRSQAEELWRNISISVADKKSAGSADIGRDFPINREERLSWWSSIDNRFPGESYPGPVIKEVMAVLGREIEESKEIKLERAAILTDALETEYVQVLRVGHSTALGVSDTVAWYLTYRGVGAAIPFRWEQITRAEYVEPIASALKSIDTLRMVPFDVMQSRQSQDLLTGETRTVKEQIMGFLESGGVLVLPLIVLLFWAVVLILNRLVVYHIQHKRNDSFIATTVSLLESGDHDKARAYGEKNRSAIARILVSSLDNHSCCRGRAEKSVREILLGEVPNIERHLDTLAVLAAAAPLLGLLGTVTGMIQMFESITRFGTGDPALLAGGISEALVTTKLGLIIAIPILIIHTFLRNRRNHIQSDLEMYAMRILNRLWPTE